jgi:anti-sigma factor RsiW
MTETHLNDTLHAYVDNELSVEGALEARAHLANCPRCRNDFEEIRVLRDVLQKSLQPTEPSATFLGKLHRSVHQLEPARQRSRKGVAAWIAAPLVAVAAALLVVLPTRHQSSADLADEVVSAHLRSLQAAHLTDVASSDRHTVKPWFQGKVPFSLTVRDFSEEGFSLEGGRLDYLDGQPVAALVYRVRQHAVNLFVWPAPTSRDSTSVAGVLSGIRTLHWTSSGMNWWLVSDVDGEDLIRLASLLRS